MHDCPIRLKAKRGKGQLACGCNFSVDSDTPSVMLCRDSSSFKASSAFFRARLQIKADFKQNECLGYRCGTLSWVCCCFVFNTDGDQWGDGIDSCAPDDESGPDSGQNQAKGADPSQDVFQLSMRACFAAHNGTHIFCQGACKGPRCVQAAESRTTGRCLVSLVHGV